MFHGSAVCVCVFVCVHACVCVHLRGSVCVRAHCREGFEGARVAVTNSEQALETMLFYIKRSLLHIQMICPTGVIKKHVSEEPAISRCC